MTMTSEEGPVYELEVDYLILHNILCAIQLSPISAPDVVNGTFDIL